MCLTGCLEPKLTTLDITKGRPRCIATRMLLSKMFSKPMSMLILRDRPILKVSLIELLNLAGEMSGR